MIITQTPLRISFLGGGSDFPGFCATETGCVLSATIDKYVYVTLKARFDDRIRVGYSRTELTDRVALVEHDLVREAMRATGLERGIEVSTMADIPSRGAGLGSSSSVTVGLLHAMWLYQGVLPSRKRLAEGACLIELERLMRPIGKQDQYAAAYGGLRFTTFEGESVTTEAAVGDDCGPVARRLSERLLLFFTGVTRRSADVLLEQSRRIEEQRATLRAMAELARQGRQALADGRLDDVGELMHHNWQLKRTLASRVTNSNIDELYAAARGAGATGGKITGAGGGGFMLLYCPPEHQAAVRAALQGLTELEFQMDGEGSRTLLNVQRC